MNSATASYSFPVLGDDRMDYGGDSGYATHDWEVNSGVVQLRHRIDGDSLVARLVQSGKAHFGISVVMKATMYRRTFIADSGGELSVAQTIAIEKGSRSLESPKFLPMVIYRGERETFVGDKSMGLDALWHGRKFVLDKGAIIARDKEWEFQPGLSSLLRAQPDPSVPEGAIQMEVAEADGGYFVVKVHPNLFREMRQAPTFGEGGARHLDSILAHALSAGFAILAAKDRAENEGLHTLENFQTIKRHLEANDVATWDDEDFDACRAAWVYKSHRIVSDYSNEGEDDE